MDKVAKKNDFLKILIYCLIALAGVFFIFKLGMMVGEMQAGFSYRWAENYHRNFAGPRDGFMKNLDGMPMPPMPVNHGNFGEILLINLPEIIIKDQNNLEINVVTNDDTVVKDRRNDLKPENLRIGQFIAVIGLPNGDGQIEAKLIRIFPTPPVFPDSRSLDLKNINK